MTNDGDREKNDQIGFPNNNKENQNNTYWTWQTETNRKREKNNSTKIQFDDLHNSTTITNRTNTDKNKIFYTHLVNTFNAEDLIHAHSKTKFDRDLLNL